MYKVGDEVLVKEKVDDVDENASDGMEVRVKIIGCCPQWIKEGEIASKTYEMGLSDVWELAKKIFEMKTDVAVEVFDCTRLFDVLGKFSPQEALSKIEAYEKENEIKPMDVVEHIGKEWIVSQVNDSEYLLWDGRNVIHVEKSTVKKVGSIGSLEQLTKLLRQIGE